MTRKEKFAKWRENRMKSYNFIHLTLLKEDHAELKLLAKSRGESVTELIRTFIIWGIDEIEKETK
jgi:hypothetical protein